MMKNIKTLLTILCACLFMGAFSACDLGGLNPATSSSDMSSVEQSTESPKDSSSDKIDSVEDSSSIEDSSSVEDSSIEDSSSVEDSSIEDSSSVEDSSIEESSMEDSSNDSSEDEPHTHVWDNGVTTKEPTCEEAGVKTFACACGESNTEEIPALGHNYENKVCTNCGGKMPSEGLAFTLNADKVSYSVTGIGTCKDTDIVIPSTYEGLPVTSIGDWAFAYCYSLTSVEIPDSVTRIDDYAFEVCTALTSVEIGHSVTSIGNYAFAYCDSLTSVEIPDSVTSIGYGAFFLCESLTSVEIGTSVTSIGDYAFHYCTSLTSVEIPDSVTSIGSYAFSACTSLTSVEIPDSVTSIGNGAFSNCTSLTSVEIPDSVTSIGRSAFSSCDSLTSITVSENNSAYKSIDGNLYTKDGTTLIQYAIGKMDTSFMIPDSVTSIGDWAFNLCTSLTSITVSENNSAYKSIDGNLYTKDGTTLIQYAIGKTDTSFTIPDSVTSIGYGAFRNCDSLTSVEIPNSVTSIGNYAFYNCDSLTSVVIGESVTSIGKWAFYNCDSLTSITFSDTSTWYRTDSYSNWNNKTGGTQVSVTSVSTNATYFKKTYYDYYWYKL